ncbi:Immunoglobulin domain-containing protein precursor [Danio rerio]|uniref:Si:ch73-27e22.7 n=1 Tax=Danio rerio TaxID=7955 RepID=E9QEI0_DANRE|nr:Immunoglobulin domain-containing protein precursor [Danio rerio]XP_017208774.1 uncharacterized protein si:ch73-27e22.7 [Danio rerio]|eukprot:XP_017208774.1 uncharacterized protein si:ch73-27e22.7 [Danio rerio]
MIRLIVYSLTLLHLFGESGAVVVQPVSVVDGDSITLEIQRNRDIEWKFGPQNILIAEISSGPYKITLHEDALDGSFRGRLKLDQTGSLTINNIRTTDSGDYNVIDTNEEMLLNTFKLTVQEDGLPSGAVILLALTAVVGLAAVAILIYEFRSRSLQKKRNVQKQADNSPN